MSSTNIDDIKEQGHNDNSDLKNQVDEDVHSMEDVKDSDGNAENPMPSPQQEVR